MAARMLDKARPYGTTRGRPGVAYTQDHSYFDQSGRFVCAISDAPPMELDEDGRIVPVGTAKPATDSASTAEMRAMIEEMRKVKAEADAALAALRTAQSAPPEPAPPEPGDEAYEDMHYTQLKALVEALEGEYTNKAEAIAFLRAKDAERAAAA